jgi:AcrR family transcriptional regulator
MAGRKPSADRILEAAETVFDQHGYGETSLRMLMSAAGVSTTAFYARFHSKEDVLAALVSRFITELTEQAVAALEEVGSLEEGFDRGVDVLVDVLSRHRVVAALALTEAAGNPNVRARLAQAYADLVELLAARIRGLAKRGPARGSDPTALAWALVGALQMQVMRWAVFGELDERKLDKALRGTARTLIPALVAAR